MNIAPSDITAILGNLLDNALTAIAHTEEKHLKLLMEYSQETLLIRMENTYDGTITHAPHNAGLISSRKPGGGQGLKTIARSVEKYNGNLKITHTGNIFSVVILLYDQNGD